MEKTNKMLIDATHPEETRVVVLREGRVEEFDFESAARKPLRGNIYLAKVTRVEPSLQAAFVDYGGNRHGFLAFSEIHPDYYQIPMADRQALLEEEAAAEAAAEAEADARAEARAGRRGGGREDEDDGYADTEPHGGATESEPASYDAAPAIAADAEGDEVRHGGAPRAEETAAFRDEAGPASDNGGDARRDGEHEVEEVTDAVEAPETLSPTENTSQDALEELPERPRRRMRSYKIQEVIKRRQIILVQVVKEERGNKGAALTTYLSLAGRYTVLMPNTGRGGGISRKITNPQDRKRLKSIAHELEVPEGMGLIIRTAGAARTKQEIKRDFEYEIRLWESVRDMTLRSTAPCLVYEEGNLIKRSIRDLFAKDIDDIVVAGEAGYTEALEFMKMLSPSQTKHVVRYEGAEPLYHRYQIERQLNAMFSPFVTLRSGGYLVINQTEALVAVDVNSGKSTREFSIEETALNTNLEAAEEISRQLKLRDLAGLIVIDFIDMEEKRNNRAVERRLKDCLRHDRARIQVGRISHFGLLEMSRQRLRTGVLEGSTSQCPHCQGTGIIRSTESVALAVLRAIEDHLLRDPRHSINVVTTADVALYILNNKRSFVTSLEARYSIAISVQASDRMQGANFAIERAHAAPAPRAPDRTAVNMDWGFEGQEEGSDESEGEETEANAAEPRAQNEEGEGRRRRRRRRGRRDERGERNGQRGPRHEPHGERHAVSAEGPNAQDDGTRPEAEHDDQPAADFDELGGQGTAAEGRVAERRTEEGTETGDREERPGGRRGRRRGRRGGRRGRDRSDAPHHNDNGAHAGPDDGPESAHADADAAAHEPAAAPVRNGNGEHRPAAEVQQVEAAPAVQRPAEPVTRIPSVEPVVPMPPVQVMSSTPAPMPEEAVHEDVARPMRKGWWQRRFSSE